MYCMIDEAKKKWILRVNPSKAWKCIDLFLGDDMSYLSTYPRPSYIELYYKTLTLTQCYVYFKKSFLG